MSASLGPATRVPHKPRDMPIHTSYIYTYKVLYTHRAQARLR